MRCLGIPNTAHFANVTQIEDALGCKCMIFFCFNKIVVLLSFNARNVVIHVSTNLVDLYESVINV